MRSRARQQGYLLIDHSVGPGTKLVPEGRRVEWKTQTCSHCNSVVAMNPARHREYGYCPKCNHFICDTCTAVRQATGGDCNSLRQRFDKMQEEMTRALQKRMT